MRPLKNLLNPVVLFKNHFFTGVLVAIPFLVIVWILASVLATLWQLHGFIPESWIPETVLNDPILSTLSHLVFVIAMTALLAFAISILGWSSKQLIGRKFLEFLGEIIQHIPVIRSIYSALDQLLKTIAQGGGQQFSRVVYIEYPRKGIWTLAFVTGPARGPAVPEHHLNVYVPTTPNPTSGFYLIVPENEVKESHMKVEDAFKSLLSLGIAQP
jgi:uncharacterized membrane protein